MEGYGENDPSKTNTMVKQASEILFAYLYLDNLDHDKYGSIIQSLNSQKSLGDDQYSRTVVETKNVLSNHKFDINEKRNRIISTQKRTRTRSIKREKKTLHPHFHKWKGGVTVA